ncbi:PAP2 superfamily protein [Spirosomataceae bacterium TFI 002]|nr:PAP2 superfamily protein [Spirosomataceae bacterium TFI 002]
MKRLTLSFIAMMLIASSCNDKTPEEYGKVTNDPIYYHDAITKLTDVIIHDIFSPPVASRIYSYASLAGYEAMVPGNPDFLSMTGQFKEFEKVTQPEEGKEYCYQLAGVKAIMTVARKLTFTVDKYDEFEANTYKAFKDSGLPSSIYERSMEYGEMIGNEVLAFSKGDNYAQTRGLRYTVKNEPGMWVPTPPQYGDAMEPYWMTIRPLILDSANQFTPPPAPQYSLDKSSHFWKELMEVYNVSKDMDQEKKDMAWFWDDNAFVMQVQGHVMFANKKMTPGGHWMAIGRTAAEKEKISPMESAEMYLYISSALHEAFICSWEEKYRSEKIRPETVINNTFDDAWEPFLQTPPFPEYTSGHSTISAASAEALTGVFGDNYAFTDSTEFIYDHGVRSFTSFRNAATECSYSRMYGGIHYRSGCEEGQAAGIRIGQYVLNKIKTRKE